MVAAVRYDGGVTALTVCSCDWLVGKRWVESETSPCMVNEPMSGVLDAVFLFGKRHSFCQMLRRYVYI